MKKLHKIILLFIPIFLIVVNAFGVGDESVIALSEMGKVDGNYSKMRVYKSKLYLLRGDSIKIVDVIDPSKPIDLDDINMTKPIKDFFVKNDKIFLYDGKRIDIYDVQNHSEKEILKDVENFYINNSNLYTVTKKGINIYEISQRGTLELIDTKENNITDIKKIFVNNNNLYFSFKDGSIGKESPNYNIVRFSKRDTNLTVVGVNDKHIFLECDKGGFLIIDKDTMMPLKQFCNFNINEIAFGTILYGSIINSGDLIILGDEDDEVKSYATYHTGAKKILDIYIDKDMPYEGNIYLLTPTYVKILYHHYAHISTDGCDIYEDAQSGTVSKWSLIDKYNILNSKIENIYDNEKKSRVIQFSDSTPLTGYYLDINSINILDMDSNISWSINTKGIFHLEFEVETDVGTKYIAYEPFDTNYLGKGNYIRLGVGKVNDGKWHNIIRDIQSDLNLAQKNVNIITIKNFKVYGNLKLDDLKLCY